MRKWFCESALHHCKAFFFGLAHLPFLQRILQESAPAAPRQSSRILSLKAGTSGSQERKRPNKRMAKLLLVEDNEMNRVLVQIRH